MIKKLFFFVLFLPCLATSQGLYDLDHIPEIRISFEETNWEEILDQTKEEKERLPATVTIDGQEFREVGVRYKGNSSYKNPKSKGHRKLPFNLKADYIDKDQTFPEGYETIKLSNVFQDASFTREILSYEIARKYMPAPRCNFAKVYVNDEYIGLYNNVQAVDDVFVKESFGTSKGTFFKCDPEYSLLRKLEERDCPPGDKASLMYIGDDESCYLGWYEMESKKDKGWEELIELTRVLNYHPEAVDTLINIDRVLWMHAFNNVLVNLDSYTGRLCHNYYLYKTPDGLFVPLVWDMNISLGGFRYDGVKKGVLTNEELQELSLFTHYKTKNPKRPLITNLLANPLYRKIYVGHCKTILEENFANGAYLEFAHKVQQIIDEEVKNDPNKLYSYADFKKNLHKTVDIGFSDIIGVEELMKKRTEHLLQHPLFNGDNPVISNVSYSAADSLVFFYADIVNTEDAYVFFKNSDEEPYQMVKMTHDGMQQWQAAATGGPGMKFYIIAEGNRLAVSYPARASHEYLSVE